MLSSLSITFVINSGQQSYHAIFWTNKSSPLFSDKLIKFASCPNTPLYWIFVFACLALFEREKVFVGQHECLLISFAFRVLLKERTSYLLQHPLTDWKPSNSKQQLRSKMTDAADKINLDNVIARLLEVRGSKPGKNVQLTENEIKGLCMKSREIFLSQPVLLELEAPLKICGWLFLSALLYYQSQFREDCSISHKPLFRRCSRPVLRLAASLRVRRISSRVQLFVPRRLCGSRYAFLDFFANSFV
jgi:hypothetical protein